MSSQNATVDLGSGRVFYNPAPYSAPNPPTLESGQFILYDGGNTGYTGVPQQLFNINSVQEGVFTSFSGYSINDKSDYVVFNLPKGVVLTLMENPLSQTDNYNFSGAGTTVDIMGTGQTETADLASCGGVNNLSGFVWRKPNLNSGFFQVFDGVLQGNTTPADWTCRRAAFFMDEWTSGKINSLDGWGYCDNLDGVAYSGLMANAAAFYDGGNGDGATQSVVGWDPVQTYCTFAQSGLINKIASWKFTILPPLNTLIQSVKWTAQGPVNPAASTGSSTSQTYPNGGTTEIQATYTYTSEQSYSTTTTTSCETTTSQEITSELSYSTPEEEALVAGQATVDVTSSFSTSKTTSSSTENQTVSTQSVQFSLMVPIPPMTATTVVGQLSIMSLGPSSIKTTASYYYSQKLPGSVEVAGADGKPQYRLDMDVFATVSGQLVANYFATVSSVAYTPPTN